MDTKELRKRALESKEGLAQVKHALLSNPALVEAFLADTEFMNLPGVKTWDEHLINLQAQLPEIDWNPTSKPIRTAKIIKVMLNFELQGLINNKDSKLPSPPEHPKLKEPERFVHIPEEIEKKKKPSKKENNL